VVNVLTHALLADIQIQTEFANYAIWIALHAKLVLFAPLANPDITLTTDHASWMDLAPRIN
jgi:hypothetical protein